MTPRDSRDTLYFDGQCGMCRRTIRVIRRLDWLHRLDFRDSTRMPPGELPVSMEMAMTGIPMRTRDGTVLVGFRAIRRALLQTPLGAAPALLMYVPGISHLAAAAYRRIAAGRRRDNGACAINPGLDS